MAHRRQAVTGDGLITGVAALAVPWSLQARARVAIGQGAFLLVLGAAVVAQTLVRVFAQRTPASLALTLKSR